MTVHLEQTRSTGMSPRNIMNGDFSPPPIRTSAVRATGCREKIEAQLSRRASPTSPHGELHSTWALRRNGSQGETSRRGRAGGPLRGSCHHTGISARRELASQAAGNCAERSSWQTHQAARIGRIECERRSEWTRTQPLRSGDGADQARELDNCRLCLRSPFTPTR
jgi:hypothetical protein